MIILKIVAFLIALVLAFKLIGLVGWLLKVGILILLIGSIVWLAQEFFGDKKSP